MSKEFIEYMLDEPERFLPYPFKQNPNISNLPQFITAFKEGFKTQSQFSDSDLTLLFDTPECQARLKENPTYQPERETTIRRISPKQVKRKRRNQRLRTNKQKRKIAKKRTIRTRKYIKQIRRRKPIKTSNRKVKRTQKIKSIKRTRKKKR